jgi:hypothetical protein
MSAQPLRHESPAAWHARSHGVGGGPGVECTAPEGGVTAETSATERAFDDAVQAGPGSEASCSVSAGRLAHMYVISRPQPRALKMPGLPDPTRSTSICCSAQERSRIARS